MPSGPFHRNLLIALYTTFLLATPLLGDSKIIKDVSYGEHKAQAIDVYLANTKEPAPVMIYIHGGGWHAGTKNRVPHYLLKANKEGWLTVVSVEYRFTMVKIHPAQVNDCSRAIQLVRHNAKKWNIDPKRIGVTGGSAGGHLSSYVALRDELAKPDSEDPVERQSSRVLFAMPFAGPMSWGLLEKINHSHPGYYELIGHKPRTPFDQLDPEKMKDVSPLNFVSADDPPILIIHGDADKVVPFEHAKVLEDALKKVNVPVELVTIKGGRHGVAGAGGSASTRADAYMREKLGAPKKK